MKVKNFLSKLKEVITNLPQIYEGIVNYFVYKDDVERVSIQRFRICNSCPEIDTKGDFCLAPGSQPCCSLCGCSLHFKTRSLSSECPAGKWKALMTEEEEEKLNS